MTAADRLAPGNIAWPEEFAPDRAPVHVRNQLDSRASPQAVWRCLVRAREWPKWYPNSQSVALPEGAQELSAGMSFRWRTFGVSLVSVVAEFVAPQRIAWSARGVGVWAYHAWLIEPKPGGCSILTEETQYGWVARLGDLFMPRRMFLGHQLWLENLDRVARAAESN
jgi:hypothetical protein